MAGGRGSVEGGGLKKKGGGAYWDVVTRVFADPVVYLPRRRAIVSDSAVSVASLGRPQREAEARLQGLSWHSTGT